MNRVEAWAAQECRSVNGQIQWIIADALRRHHRMSNPVPPADLPPNGEDDVSDDT